MTPDISRVMVETSPSVMEKLALQVPAMLVLFLIVVIFLRFLVIEGKRNRQFIGDETAHNRALMDRHYAVLEKFSISNDKHITTLTMLAHEMRTHDEFVHVQWDRLHEHFRTVKPHGG